MRFSSDAHDVFCRTLPFRVFQKIRPQNNLVALHLANPKGGQALVKIWVKEACGFQGTLPPQFFHGHRVDVAEGQVQRLLSCQADGPEISSLGTDTAQGDMVVLEAAFLAGLHGIAVKHPRAARAAIRLLHEACRRELRAAVGQQDLRILAEDFPAEDLLQRVHSVQHVLCGLCVMVNGDHDAAAGELERLDERPVGAIVVDRVHLRHETVRIFLPVCLVIHVCPTFQVCMVLALLIACGILLGELAAHLPAQVHDGSAGDLLEDTALDVVVERFLADAELRMGLEDCVWRQPLL